MRRLAEPIVLLFCGLQWVVQDARRKRILGRAVINFSVGGPTSAATNNALIAAHNAGVFMVAAAGNDGDNALTYTSGCAHSICVPNLGTAN
ncbi:Suppressor of the cold-sensitive snRNP biogenesis mutant brr1-1 [Coccidioides posadasii str. Silveira]|uniref:Suppressor of the cold-sensitive snRNP biogenesis mutant brr1-1 n=1 Tax=Coccidioides posadasii (strain RMSCC 757 / Silveira) TaxID=443226 RepID=UPI001BF10828|nr:Suppressor of the cold-sensitive snRNP biogenesis mutant brr1-1 [Coccidioides posadasii str. Silveira]